MIEADQFFGEFGASAVDPAPFIDGKFTSG
jgi:hypothetical protein